MTPNNKFFIVIVYNMLYPCVFFNSSTTNKIFTTHTLFQLEIDSNAFQYMPIFAKVVYALNTTLPKIRTQSNEQWCLITVLQV